MLISTMYIFQLESDSNSQSSVTFELTLILVRYFNAFFLVNMNLIIIINIRVIKLYATFLANKQMGLDLYVNYLNRLVAKWRYIVVVNINGAKI